MTEIPAGWYPDPSGVQQMRWWTGIEWTEHVTPMPAAGNSTREHDAKLRRESAEAKARVEAERREQRAAKKAEEQAAARESKTQRDLDRKLKRDQAEDERRTKLAREAERRATEHALATAARRDRDEQREQARIASETAEAERWARITNVLQGERISRAARDAVLEQCQDGESPWLVLGAGTGGVLAGFEDRLLIVKVGGLTSMMAGSLGGGRTTTFYFRDITAIEYNAGMMNGVLEVLTASYQGGANKDFWRGTASPRNRDSNDPFTLSNTLPLIKPAYRAALPQINELRARISRAKTQSIAVTNQPLPPVSDTLSIPQQLADLAHLHQTGALTDDEYSAAKARVISENQRTVS